MHHTHAMLIGIAVLSAVGCVAATGPVPSESKDVARAEGGKADGSDPCADNGWYGDGECDTFCPSPDPDCDDGGHSACGGPSEWTCETGTVCLNGEGDDCRGPECLGLCIEAPRCVTDADCEPVERCIPDPDPECTGTTLGRCYIRPLSCAPADPVCGCDGQTYLSACSARDRLAPIAYEGECAAEMP